jgi:hypothetical protein
MSIPSQGVNIAFATQNKKSNEVGYVAPTNWYQTRSNRITFGAKQMDEMFPFQLGSEITPPGVFKAGVYGKGEIDLIVHLEHFIGHILRGVFGSVTTVEDAKWDNATNAPETTGDTPGVNTHTFKFDPAGSHILPWMGMRMKVPGLSSAQVYGEQAVDGKIDALRINIPAAGLITATVSLCSRIVTFPLATTVNGWAYANGYEDANSAAHAGTGSFLIGGVKYPITSLSIDVINNLTKPEQEMVVGSYFPDDFVPLSRMIRLSMMYKWENPTLYKKIMAGQDTNTDWDTMPFIQDTSGVTKAVDATFFSQGNIPGSTERNMLKFIGNRVAWQLERGGLEFAPQNIIMVPFSATLLTPATGQDYASISVVNAATYA